MEMSTGVSLLRTAQSLLTGRTIHDRIKSNLDSKRNESNKILENRLNGYITRTKAQIIEQNGKNSKYIAGLVKKV